MAATSRAVIARGGGASVTIEEVLIPDPGPHDVIVRVVACGVCHSDLGSVRRAHLDGRPVALGHETAGIVEVVGDEVTSIAPGDSVIIAWRAPCGVCEACRRGFAAMCESSLVGSKPAVLADGTTVNRMLGIGGFADRVFVASAQCVKYDPAIRAEAAALIGCGVMTGFGATAISAPVRPGDSVAVFGCGGVGDAAIAGAHFAGASMIIAVDVNPKKLEWAKRFGATHFVDASSTDAVQAVLALTKGRGADVAVEAVGTPAAYLAAFEAHSRTGVLVQVGVPDADAEVTLSLRQLFQLGPTRPSWYGDCIPSRDFPVLLSLYQQGRLDLDAFITETIALEDVPSAFEKIEAGTVLRSVVVL
jgi:S-(hydroxymethyl)mycothiol dehydrogenase